MSNFKNFGNDPPADGGGGRPPGGFPLTRQPSVYSLTFDELQSTMGGIGKDFGSMNMDELLKNIWSAEENQNLGSTCNGGGQEGGGGGLQRQGSVVLPRTLSQKTVDQVWRDMSKDASGGSAFGVPQRQHTLGEITLEEFLVRAGIVREENDDQLETKPSVNNVGSSFGDLWHPVNDSFGFQHQQQQQAANNQIAIQSATNFLLNESGANHQQQQQQQQQQQILPKQPTTMAYGPPMGIPSSNQMGSPRIKSAKVGISSNPVMNNNMGGLGMVGLGANNGGSPAVSTDGMSKSNNGDNRSYMSPVPYVFNNGGLRGRKGPALEKVVERRQRRMIKNRESAARSRARKQAYTMELEAEVADLKEEHKELQKKQAEMMEMQKNQLLEMMKQQNGTKERTLRRTQTGPW